MSSTLQVLSVTVGAALQHNMAAQLAELQVAWEQRLGSKRAFKFSLDGALAYDAKNSLNRW